MHILSTKGGAIMSKSMVFVYLCLFQAISGQAATDSSHWAEAIHVNQMSAAIRSVEQAFNGDFVAAGQEQIHRTQNVLFIRLNPSGEIKWAKSYGSKDASAHVNATLQTSDGGFVFVGRISNQRGLRRDALIVKLDVAGNILWQKAYGTSSSASDDEAIAITQAEDGGFFLLGNSMTPSPPGDGLSHVWCMKLSSDGNVLWHKTYGKRKTSQTLYGAVTTKDGGLVFVGRTSYFPWVVRLNQEGSIRWQKELLLPGPYYNPTPTAITATADHSFIVIGSIPGYVIPGSGWAVKLGSGGALKWQTRFYHEKESVSATAVRQENDGHILVMGTALRFETTGLFLREL
jgi:hypothetical protein